MSNTDWIKNKDSLERTGVLELLDGEERLPLHAPRGTELHCKGWIQEAALRMLLNNLDPEVGENPDELIVYGGSGKAARNWDCLRHIVKSLLNLENDETLLIQSGKPVGIFKTHENAPRILIANALIVPAWATYEKFREFEQMGLTMFGQMTAGSWIYIGTQGILQGTYETFAEIARRHFRGTLAGKLVVSAGLGGMGGAQPLSVTMNEGVALIIEVDRTRIERRLHSGYCNRMAEDLDTALDWAFEAKRNGQPLSIGLLGNAADILTKLVNRGITPDILTDQTSAHDPLNGYVPAGCPLETSQTLRRIDPENYIKMAMHSIYVHVQAMLELQKRGSIVFEYGNRNA